MKVFYIIIIGLIGLCSCNRYEPLPKPTPVVVFDSSTIIASGENIRITLQDNAYVDTGMYVLVKGKGFDVSMKNDYFLELYTIGGYAKATDTRMDVRINARNPMRDDKMIAITDSTILYRFSKNEIYSAQSDTAYLYFGKIIHGSYREQDHRADMRMSATNFVPIKPLFKLLSDTLSIFKSNATGDRSIFATGQESKNMQVLIGQKEVPHLRDVFFDSRNYSKPTNEYNTVSIRILQSQFSMPDGWYSLEIKQSITPFQNFVEVTGKNRVYIKNEK